MPAVGSRCEFITKKPEWESLFVLRALGLLYCTYGIFCWDSERYRQTLSLAAAVLFERSGSTRLSRPLSMIETLPSLMQMCRDEVRMNSIHWARKIATCEQIRILFWVHGHFDQFVCMFNCGAVFLRVELPKLKGLMEQNSPGSRRQTV